MSNEELNQRGYLEEGLLKGDAFGVFELLDIGATTIGELINCGLDCAVAASVAFPFNEYKATKNPKGAKPDRIILDRRKGTPVPVVVVEWKKPKEFDTDKKETSACEQALFSASAMGVRVAVATDGKKFRYIDVAASLNDGNLVRFSETRKVTPSVIEDLLAGSAAVAKNPTQLAHTVWQLIWQATKEEPKQCLLTFVELFVLKFLSDNLPDKDLPKRLSFYALVDKEIDAFKSEYGMSQIEYYVTHIRPHIKKLFPDNTVASDDDVPHLFGLNTVVSKTSLINGFAFLRSSSETVASFNRTFLEILHTFKNFGSLTNIDPEFKLRLYETFLKNTPRQQTLGQFFTPRNVVREMIRMAQLSTLPDDAVVLDPAAGVGGFVLEPLLLDHALKGNIKLSAGKSKRRIKMIGVDMDVNTHILAKANMLIHMAELLNEPSTTLPAVNNAMANTFVLMNTNETLGALENPPQGAVDVILANPPYVTQGSAIYRKEIAELAGLRNGADLKDYYDGWGLGVEALFLRYISGALKPGGRAYVIVPLGMLNRTEKKPKQKLLDECNILASISLPRNTFFNTSQLTCILVLERRYTESDPRPDILCGYARSTGETLDMYRVPTPDRNDLEVIAKAFLEYQSTPAHAPTEEFIKVVSPDEFTADDRWDVARFWTEDELVKLGVKAAAISRNEFIDDAIMNIQELAKELQTSKEELLSLTSGETRLVELSDKALFRVRAGTRITNTEVRVNSGEIPVYSCFKLRHLTKGSISEDYLLKENIQIEDSNKEIVTIAANGASVGTVFTRKEKCVVTDDLIVVELLNPDIDAEYLATELRKKIAAGGFIYEAKLFKGRAEQLTADIPVGSDGTFDLDRQREIAAAEHRFDLIREKLHELGNWSEAARID